MATVSMGMGLARGRPPAKQRMIVRALRGMIVRGVWAPGERIPPRAALARRFRAGPHALQKAMARLRAEGWIRARGRRGTFVAEALPHWTRYALILPDAPRHPGGTGHLFLQAYTVAAEAITEEGPRSIRVVHGINGVLRGDEIARLILDAREHRMAGVILADHPVRLADAKAFAVKGVYRVAISEEEPYPDCPTVGGSFQDFATQALRALKAQGRRRVAFILGPCFPGARHRAAAAAAAESEGLAMRPYWIQHAHPIAPDDLPPLVQLLMKLPSKERPDALVLGDDHFAEPATRALASLGVRAPEDIEIVSLCNYPVLPATALPVRWLGYDARMVIERCCEVIDRQRRGEPLERREPVKIIFEREWKELERRRAGARRRAEEGGGRTAGKEAAA